MADNTHKLALDKAGLKNFVDNQIVPFGKSIDKIAHEDTAEGVTVNSIIGRGHVDDKTDDIFKAQRPLSIGLLAGEDTRTNGKGVVAQVNKVGESVSDIFISQTKLFNDLHLNLDRTITKLMDGQHENLVKIDGKLFLDSLGTVPGDFQGSGPAQS
jgi:hypothetical protein